jgi:hypothetical protein
VKIQSDEKMKKCLLACSILIILVSTSIVSAENVISKGMVNSQSSTQILTRKDIPILSNTITLSKDTETREILTEIRDKITTHGSITEQELKELFEGFGWRPFIGLFSLYTDTEVMINPGHHMLYSIGFYIGPFIVGSWDSGDLIHFFKARSNTEGIVFLGVGLAFTMQSDPGARIFTTFNGVCILGFYKQY